LLKNKLKTMNKFIINYDKKTLVLSYQNEIYYFNLRCGDVGDFWHTFTNKKGIDLSINFHQEIDCTPNLEIWDFVQDEAGYYSYNECIDIVYKYELFGNPLNYFLTKNELI